MDYQFPNEGQPARRWTLTLNPPELLAAYESQYETFKALAERVRRRLDAGLKHLSIDLTIKARAKKPAHVVLKAIRKAEEQPDQYAADPLGAMGDKAGARVIVPDLPSVKLVRDTIHELFEVVDEEDKGAGLAPTELGYLGVHLEVTLPSYELASDEQHFRDLRCEIQVHTSAQSAWAVISHPLLYKPKGGEPDRELEKRVYRLVSLVSLFDDEVMAARLAQRKDPRYRPAVMYDILSKAAIPWATPDGWDEGLSHEVLAVVAETYDESELDNYEQVIEDFLATHRDALTAILNQYRPLVSEHESLFQPEVIAMYERLLSKPLLLRAHWRSSQLPDAWFEDFSLPLGQGTLD